MFEENVRYVDINYTRITIKTFRTFFHFVWDVKPKTNKTLIDYGGWVGCQFNLITLLWLMNDNKNLCAVSHEIYITVINTMEAKVLLM